VAAAGLDVFEHQHNMNHDYFGIANAFLMSHVAGATVEPLIAVHMRALDNIEAYSRQACTDSCERLR
jgi:lactate dehydrogenase-like 2-hydroxyacid dehydrogenase